MYSNPSQYHRRADHFVSILARRTAVSTKTGVFMRCTVRYYFSLPKLLDSILRPRFFVFFCYVLDWSERFVNCSRDNNNTSTLGPPLISTLLERFFCCVILSDIRCNTAVSRLTGLEKAHLLGWFSGSIVWTTPGRVHTPSDASVEKKALKKIVVCLPPLLYCFRFNPHGNSYERVC